MRIRRLSNQEKLLIIYALKKVIDACPQKEDDPKVCDIWSNYVGNILRIVYEYTDRLEFLFAIEEIKNFVGPWDVFGQKERIDAILNATNTLRDLCKNVIGE